MSFLFSYLAIGVIGIALFIAIDVMGGLNQGSEKWNGINPVKRFKEFWEAFKDDSSCIVSCKEGLKICSLVVLLWPLIIIAVIIGLYKTRNTEIKENNEED